MEERRKPQFCGARRYEEADRLMAHKVIVVMLLRREEWDGSVAELFWWLGGEIFISYTCVCIYFEWSMYYRYGIICEARLSHPSLRLTRLKNTILDTRICIQVHV